MISIALICLLCIGAVSAAEDVAADDLAAVDGEDIGSIDEDMSENDDLSLEAADASGDESGDVLAEEETKTFTQLKEEIANPVDGVVTLSGTYKYDETADAALLRNQGVVIRSNITINGPATIDGSNLSRIFYLYQSSATLNGLTFINGKGQQYGGAVLAYGLSPTIKNCIFKNNLVTDDSEDISYGGAIYFWLTTGATVSNCTFEDNVADLGIMGAGGAIYDYSDGLTIKDSTFTHNQAFTGGALESYGSNMNINKCLFDSNQAISGSDPYYNGEGGAVMLDYVWDDEQNPVECNHKITQSVFINNQAGNVASTLKNEAIGTTIKDCIFLGPNTIMGNSIFSGCDSGTECENIWLGHTTENQSTYVSGGPDNWLVLDLNAEAKEGYYDVIASLNHLYTRSTGEVTDVESGISGIKFNVAATAGTCADTVEIQDGIGTIIYKLYKPEDGTISVDYNGVTKSLSLEGLEKPPEDVNLVINVDDIKKGETAKVEGQLTDLNGDGIENADLVVTVNGVENNVATGADGKFSFDVEGLDAGQYSAFVTFAGNNAYNRAVNSTIFNVKAQPVLEVHIDDIKEGEDAIINVTLFDGDTGLNGVVEVSVTGYDDPFVVAVADGFGTRAVTGLDVGTYTFNATSRATSDYSSASTQADTFEVKEVIKTNPNLIVSVDNIKVGQTAKVEGQLTDSNGNGIEDAKVVVVVNGVKHNFITNAEGKFSWDVANLAVGQYTALAVFSGDDNFNPAYKSVVFKVDVDSETLIKTNLTINVSDIKKGETAKVEGQLSNAQTSEGISGLALSVFVNGVERSINTGADGKFSFDVEGLDAGQYTAFVTFEGNDAYASSSDSTIFNVKKEPTLVDISVDGGNIVVNVTDEEGNPVDGAQVSITLDGVEANYTTSNGIVNIPAASGGHNMSITTEDGKTIMVKVVAGESAEDKIGTNISVSHTSISTYNKTIDSKNDAYVLVTLKDANGNVLANKAFKFILNGKVYEYVTDGNGQKKISILSAAKKTLSAVVLISGDEKYAESIQAVNIKINPQKVKLVAKKKTFKANKKVKKFKATLTNSKGKALKGKKIVFIINKKKYTAKTNKKGVATVKVKLSKKKTYKVSIKFAGDNTYKKASKKSSIVIK